MTIDGLATRPPTLPLSVSICNQRNSVSEQPLERPIGEVESIKVVEAEPANLIVFRRRKVGNCARPFGDHPGVKREIWSWVVDPERLHIVDSDRHAQFFAKLSSPRL